MNHRVLDNFGNETLIMGFMASQKPERIDLMQNCDLPPPSKVFMGSDKAVMLSVNKMCSRKVSYTDQDSEDFGIRGESGLKDDNPDVLIRALRSSQTRARDAERRVACLTKERDCLSELLLAEAMNDFAHRQLLRLLEFQVSRLQSEKQQRQQTSYCNCGGSYEDGEDKSSLTWMAVVAICWGLAGVAVTLGYL